MRLSISASFALAGLLSLPALHGQITGPITTNAPVVVVTAPLPYAYEGGAAGAFRIARSGSTSNSLAVWFTLGGTASNGVDYSAISNNSVIIPAGAESVRIPIVPIDDSLVEPTESVVLHLQPSPLLSPVVQYFIGTPAEALVSIIDNDPPPPTNHPPVVRIVSPTNNSVFTAPVDITIFAEPHDDDGTVVSVEFFQGTNSLGVVVPNPLALSPINPWNLTWSNVPPGVYALRALATDNAGASSFSPPVYITVRRPEVPRAVINIAATDTEASESGNEGRFLITRSGETNVAVTVSLGIGGTAVNGVDYGKLPDSVFLDAGVTSAELVVTPIDDSLVERTEYVVLTVLPPVCAAIFPPPADCYVVGPSNTAAVYILDNDSTNVPPPPTNRIPVVTVTAPDPFAIEGPFTNLFRTNIASTNWVICSTGLTFTSSIELRTNIWQTNTATFRISRGDATNGDLTVFYALGGTASNGVDYLSLPGSVTIPAGERSARVVVVPIDDSLVEGIETVVLRLTPSPMASLPTYSIGWPNQAAAVIIDNDAPRPCTRVLADSLVHFCFPGTNGFIYRLECSTNLIDWVPVHTNVVTEGAVQFVDPDAPATPNRFYRVLPELALPPQ